jgi:hypothetical protein
MVLAEGILFVKLMKVDDDWLWHSGRTGSKPELEFGYFGKLAMESAEGMMENTGYETVGNALCGPLHWMMIAAEVGWSLAPYSFLDSRNMGAIFCAMVGFIFVVHAVWRPECIWVSAATTASTCCTPL